MYSYNSYIYGIYLSIKCWFLNNKFLVGENGPIRLIIDSASFLWPNVKIPTLETNWTKSNFLPLLEQKNDVSQRHLKCRKSPPNSWLGRCVIHRQFYLSCVGQRTVQGIHCCYVCLRWGEIINVTKRIKDV